jgi:dTDP-4-dehydrorhamnose reductase
MSSTTNGSILITGGTGYLGGTLVRRALASGATVAATYFSQAPAQAGPTWLPLDVSDALLVEEALDQLRPRAVIHTAFRQGGPGLWPITAEGAANVARAAQAVGARLVHISSDVIFDGEREGSYTEADAPAPISDYGRAKAAAEAFVAAVCPGAAIVRTSLIYGFAPLDIHTRFILSIADGGSDALLFSDEFRCPIFVDDLADALLELAQTDFAGPINIAGNQRLSRHGFGRLLAAAHGRDPDLLRPGLNAESGLSRPRNCTLDITLARKMLRTPLRGVEEVVAQRKKEAG